MCKYPFIFQHGNKYFPSFFLVWGLGSISTQVTRFWVAEVNEAKTIPVGSGSFLPAPSGLLF